MPLDESTAPQSATPTPDWPPLDRSLLGESRAAPPPFPLPLLPGRWRGWVEASSRVFGSADYLAQCLLGGVACVCGAGTRISVTSHWFEPLLLWQALVGGPSSGKSAAFECVQDLLIRIEPREGSGDREAVTVLADSGLKQVSSALTRSSRGVLLWRGDLAAWMDDASTGRGAKGHVGRRATQAAWLAGWNAGPVEIGYHDEDCFAVGITGALTPDDLAPRGLSPALLSQGPGFLDGNSALAARFLYVWPELGPDHEVSLADEGADDEGIAALLQKIANTADHRATPGIIELDEAATRRLEALIPALRRRAGELADKGADGMAAEWIAKGVPTIVRLAGLLSLMEWAEQEAEEPTEPTVGAPHIEAAHELWSAYYLPQAMSVFDRSGVGAGERNARRVARWLRHVHVPEISREEIRRDALARSVDAEGAEDVLARLEAGGLLRALPASGSSNGGPRRRRWLVNPQLATS